MSLYKYISTVIAGNRNPEIAREMYPGISGLHIALTWEWACLQTSGEINLEHWDAHL